MNEDTRFGSPKEGRRELRERGVPEEVIDDLYAGVDVAAEALIAEYDANGSVDRSEVGRSLQIGFGEAICGFIDAGVTDPMEVRRLVRELHRQPVRQSMLVAGRVSKRNRDMRHLFGAMLKRQYSGK